MVGSIVVISTANISPAKRSTDLIEQDHYNFIEGGV